MRVSSFFLLVCTILPLVNCFFAAPSLVSFPCPSHLFSKASATAASSSRPSTSLSATLALFGASGLTSCELIYQALRPSSSLSTTPSHKVVGLTRTPSKLSIPVGSGSDLAGLPLLGVSQLRYPSGLVSNEIPSNLEVRAGSATSYADVLSTLTDGFRMSGNKGVDAVVIALGGKTSDVGTDMLKTSTENIVKAFKSSPELLSPGCRLVVVSSIGVGDSKSQAPFFFRILMATVMSKIFADKNAQERVVKESGLPYVLVRPGGLTVAPPTGVVKVLTNESGSISRADLADFLLKAALDKDFEYVGKAPCISSVEGTGWVKDRSDKARTGKAEE